jgi:hypothetical protein
MLVIDFKSIKDVKSKMDRHEARKLLSEILNHNPHQIYFSGHGLKQMEKRQLKTGDVLNVLQAGKIYDEAEFENGSWRYRVQTRKMTVVVAFQRPNQVAVVTAWRNS